MAETTDGVTAGEVVGAPVERGPLVPVDGGVPLGAYPGHVTRGVNGESEYGGGPGSYLDMREAGWDAPLVDADVARDIKRIEATDDVTVPRGGVGIQQ